jgi:hypothetical protein
MPKCPMHNTLHSKSSVEREKEEEDERRVLAVMTV